MPRELSRTLAPGFSDPVMDGQQCFRAVMRSLSFPGTCQTLPRLARVPEGVAPAGASILAALADMDTPLWLGQGLMTPQVLEFFRFHCGCPLVEQGSKASFALVADPAAMPRLTEFSAGTPEYPDQSTTIIMQVKDLRPGRGTIFAGPGIPETIRLQVEGVPGQFWEERAGLQPLYPMGVDILFVSGESVAAVPRTTTILEA